MFDSHCHIQFPVYDADRDDVIRRAREAGVKMIAVGTQLSTSEAAVALAEKFPEEIFATVGFHPNHLAADWYRDRKEHIEGKPEQFDAERFDAFAGHPKVVAIGECGLDYYRSPKNQSLKIKNQNLQKEVFLAQAGIAENHRKALMIHCRPSKGTDDAYEDLLWLLASRKLSVFPLVHFYVGSPAITKKFLDAGFYFIFGGVITFARDYDEVIRMIPLDRILLETDAPYVAPEPHRGKRNEPGYIIETAKKLAEVKGIDLEKLEAALEENARSVFAFK